MAQFLFWIVAFVSSSINALGEDCRIPRPFEVNNEQELSGRLYDIIGGGLGGVQLTLISDKKVVRYVRTDSSGRFDFGKLPNSKYQLRFRETDTTLCAPEVRCDKSSCTVDAPMKRSITKSDGR
jgi:hypothetical protein